MSAAQTNRETKSLTDEPKNETRILPLEEDEESRPKPRRIWPPPPNARCAGCGSAELSSIPSFAVGAGLGARPFAEDTLCRRCGHIAPPRMEPAPPDRTAPRR